MGNMMNQAATTEQPSENPEQNAPSLSQNDMSTQQSLTNNTGMEAKIQNSGPTTGAASAASSNKQRRS